MSISDYQITIPYKDYLKAEQISKDYNKLKKAITDCYEEQENDIMLVNMTKLKNIALDYDLLPIRQRNYNYTEVR